MGTASRFNGDRGDDGISGGHWDYAQYYINTIAEGIESLVLNNGSEHKDEWGNKLFQDYPPIIIEKLSDAVRCLKAAYIYAQRVDWLVSGDDGEDTFLSRLEDDFSKL